MSNSVKVLVLSDSNDVEEVFVTKYKVFYTIHDLLEMTLRPHYTHYHLRSAYLDDFADNKDLANAFGLLLACEDPMNIILTDPQLNERRLAAFKLLWENSPDYQF